MEVQFGKRNLREKERFKTKKLALKSQFSLTSFVVSPFNYIHHLNKTSSSSIIIFIINFY